jgi:hypothetical protein
LFPFAISAGPGNDLEFFLFFRVAVLILWRVRAGLKRSAVQTSVCSLVPGANRSAMMVVLLLAFMTGKPIQDCCGVAPLCHSDDHGIAIALQLINMRGPLTQCSAGAWPTRDATQVFVCSMHGSREPPFPPIRDETSGCQSGAEFIFSESAKKDMPICTHPDFAN